MNCNHSWCMKYYECRDLPRVHIITFCENMIPFIFFKFFEKLAKAIFEWNYNKFSRSILLIKNTLRYLCFDVNLHFIKKCIQPHNLFIFVLNFLVTVNRNFPRKISHDKFWRILHFFSKNIHFVTIFSTKSRDINVFKCFGTEERKSI